MSMPDFLTLVALLAVLLIATPILRVGFSVLAFALQEDRMYASITLLVLVVLLGSLSGLVHPPR